MKKHNATKRALISSILIFSICFSMFVGTTFAWFTDSVTSAGNIIKSGTLDVSFHWMDGDEDPSNGTWIDASEGAIFKSELWEPGYTAARHIKIGNEGTLALKYQLKIVPDGNVDDLSDVIDVYFIDGATQIGDRTELPESAKLGNLTDVLAMLPGKANGTLLADDEATVTIALKMQESAGNEYQNKQIGSSFSIQLLATQLTYENDSFDNKYDSDSEYAVVYTFDKDNELFNFAPNKADASSSKLRIENGKAVVDGGGAWYTIDTDLTRYDYSVSYDLDISGLADGSAIVVDTGDQTTWNSTPIYIERGSANVYYGVAKNEFLGTLEGTNINVSHNYAWDADCNLVVTTTVSDSKASIVYEKAFPSTELSQIYWDIFNVTESGVVTMDNFTEVATKTDIKNATQLNAVFSAAEDGDVIDMPTSFNTSATPLAETIVIDKDITLNPNGMYLVSSTPSTFTVAEGGKLTITDGSFTVKNTSTNGAAVVVDGGEFVMAGGSFDAHTAIRTTEGKSSTVTLAAGWSNRVTVGIDSKGDDVINVTGGTLISSQESIITNGKTTINISGGTLSGKPARQNQYNPSIVCNDETIINMTGGKIETTANQSIAVNILKNSEINLSGDAVISGTNAGIRVGDFSGRNPGDNCEINISGNAKVTANGAGNNWKIGFAIQANATNTTINVSDNAIIEGSSYGVMAGQEGCAVNISGNASVKAKSGSEGYGVGAPYIKMTGGTVEAKNYGIISDMANSTVIIDNSTSLTPITISGGTYDVYVHSTTNYTQAGDPVFDTFGTRS